MNTFISEHGYELTKLLEQLTEVERRKRLRSSKLLSLDYKQVAVTNINKQLIELSHQETNPEIEAKIKSNEDAKKVLESDIDKIKSYLQINLPATITGQENDILNNIRKKFKFEKKHIYTRYLPAFVTAFNKEKKRKENLPLYTSRMGTVVDKERVLMNRSFSAKKPSILKTHPTKSNVKKSDSFQFDEMKHDLIDTVSAEASYMTPIQKEALISIGEALAVLSKSENNSSSFTSTPDDSQVKKMLAPLYSDEAVTSKGGRSSFLGSTKNSPNLSPIFENDSVTSKSSIRITPFTKAEKVQANDYEKSMLTRSLIDKNDEFSDHADTSSPELPDLRKKWSKKSLAEEFLDDEAESRYNSSYCTVDDETKSQESTKRSVNDSTSHQTLVLSSDEEKSDEEKEREKYRKYKRAIDRLLEDD